MEHIEQQGQWEHIGHTRTNKPSRENSHARRKFGQTKQIERIVHWEQVGPIKTHRTNTMNWENGTHKNKQRKWNN